MKIMSILGSGHMGACTMIGGGKMAYIGTNSTLKDFGGIQKEAYMLGVPCVTMRENTEWVETVEDGWNVLVGADHGMIVDAIEGFEGADVRGDVFGRGDASEKVCEVLNNHSFSLNQFVE